MYHDHDKMKALVKKLNGNTHLAQTYRIASAITCDWKYNLPEIMGVIAEQSESYIAGDISHRVLEIGLPQLNRLLLHRPTRNEIIAVLDEPMNIIFERARNQGASFPNIEYHIELAQDRLDGISQVLEDKMGQHALPRRILTEITITNTLTGQEGRVDSIFEYDHQKVETVDWKTYGEPKLTGHDSYQVIAYGMLVNFRYGRREDDFSNNRLTVITPNGVHHPRPTLKAIQKIREKREYILNVLRGQRPRPHLAYPTVCQSCPYRIGCNDYRNLQHTPRNRVTWARTFSVLDKRQHTHMNKFLASQLPISSLSQFGIAESGYHIKQVSKEKDRRIIKLGRANQVGRLDSGNTVRIIALEADIPLLACISCNGKILDIDDENATIEVDRGDATQLMDFEILLLKTEVDLTKRDVEAIDFVRRQPGRIQDLAFALIGEDNGFRIRRS